MRTRLMAKNSAKRTWFLVDAKAKTLGRIATRIASVLIGKHKPDFTPHADTGDCVVVVNAGLVHLTGKKLSDKIYRQHSQFPGGLRSQTAGEVKAQKPERLVEWAVRGMLPLNKLRAPRMKRLRVFAGADHGQMAQQPQELKGV